MMTTVLRSLLACALCLLAAPALAQQSTLVGTVLSAATKQPAPDVVVIATSPSLQGEQVVVTNEQGGYRISQLPPGVYTLRFETDGSFGALTRTGINLRVNQTIRVNARLVPPGTEPPSSRADIADAEFMKSLEDCPPGACCLPIRRHDYNVLLLCSVTDSNCPRTQAPSWALAHMPVLIPDGTPQTVYRASMVEVMR